MLEVLLMKRSSLNPLFMNREEVLELDLLNFFEIVLFYFRFLLIVSIFENLERISHPIYLFILIIFFNNSVLILLIKIAVRRRRFESSIGTGLEMQLCLRNVWNVIINRHLLMRVSDLAAEMREHVVAADRHRCQWAFGLVIETRILRDNGWSHINIGHIFVGAYLVLNDVFYYVITVSI